MNKPFAIPFIIVCLLCSASVSAVITTDKLLVYWPLTNTTDMYGGRFNGSTATLPDTWTGCKNGGCYRQTSTAQYINTTMDFKRLGVVSWTFNVWVNETGDSKTNVLFTSQTWPTGVALRATDDAATPKNSVGILADGAWPILCDGGTDCSPYQPTLDNRWSMLTFSYDALAGRSYLYINGTLLVNKTAGSNSTFVCDWQMFKAYCDGTASVDELAMDEVAVWNESLPSPEITELWNGGAGNFTFYQTSGGGGGSPTDTVYVTNALSPSTVHRDDVVVYDATCFGNLSTWYYNYYNVYNGSTVYASNLTGINITANTSRNVFNISPNIVSKGQNWTVEGWCGDGVTNSSKLNASKVVVNSAPVISSVTSVPSPVYGNPSWLYAPVFNLTVTASDADNDYLDYRCTDDVEYDATLATVYPGLIDEPSFEGNVDIGWRTQRSSALYSENRVHESNTDGYYALKLLSTNGAITANDYISQWQMINFTRTSNLTFDLTTNSDGGTGCTVLNARVLIDTTPYYTLGLCFPTDDIYSISIDTSAISGVHNLTLQLFANTSSGSAAARTLLFDNLRLYAAPGETRLLAGDLSQYAYFAGSNNSLSCKAYDGESSTSDYLYSFVLASLPNVSTGYFSPSPAYKNSTVLFYANCSGTNLTAYYTTFKDGVQDATGSRQVVDEVFTNVVNLTANTLSKGSNWTVQTVCGDLFYNSTALNATIQISNYVPTFNEALTAQSVAENHLFSYDANCSDADADTITYSSNSTLFTINSSNGNMSFTPNLSQSGVYPTSVSCGDGVGTTTTSFTLTVENNPVPSTATVTLTPSTAYFNTTFNCSWSYADTGGEAQTGTLWNYTNNGNLVLNGTFNAGDSYPLLNSSYFAQDDVIACNVLPSDGWQYGSPKSSNNVTIGNYVPSFTSTSITPLTAYKSSILSCTANGVADPENNTVGVSYGFFNENNGTYLQSFSSNNLFDCSAAAGCTKGVNISCGAYVYDTYGGNGITLNTTRFINNSAPVASAVFISPLSANTSTNLTCNFTYNDVDNDAATIYFAWYKDGVNQNLSTVNVLNSSLTDGDSWVCQVTPNDGLLNGTAVNSSNVIIGGNNPSIISVSVPVKNDVGSSMQFNISWNDPYLPNGTYYLYVCNSTNINLTGCQNTTLCTATGFNASPVTCLYNVQQADPVNMSFSVRIYDELNLTHDVYSSVFVVNHAPTITSNDLSVSLANTTNTFTCTGTGAADADADSIFTLYQFTDSLGAVLQAESTSNTYSCVDCEGDQYNCRVRTYDGRLYSAAVNDNTFLRAYNASLSASAVTQGATLTMNCNVYNNSQTPNIYVWYTSPSGLDYNQKDMTFNSTTGKYERSIQPTELGTWTVSAIRASGSEVYRLPLNYTFEVATTVSTPVAGAGGGGAPVVINTITNATVSFCGDGVCQDVENPLVCQQDCKVNVDSLFTCIWNGEDCAYGSAWFVTFIIGVLISGGAYVLYKEATKSERKRNSNL